MKLAADMADPSLPENSVSSSRASGIKLLARASQEQKSYNSELHSGQKNNSGGYYDVVRS